MANELNIQLVEVTAKLTSAEKKLADARRAYNSWHSASNSSYISSFRAEVEKRDGGYCARKYSRRSKREECQNELNAKVANMAPKYQEIISRRATTKSQVESLTAEVENLKSQRKALEQQIQSLSESAVELAKTGETVDSALLRAKTDSAIAMKSADVEASKDKNIQLIVLIGSLLLLVVLAIVLYRKFIKKKK